MTEPTRGRHWKHCSCRFRRCVCAILVLSLMIVSTDIYQQVKIFIVPHEAKVDLRLKVLTSNRTESLKRLLNSLNNAEYDTDIVVLEIWIDRFKSNDVPDRTVQAAREFVFLKGESNVYIHTTHVGIRGQWLTTWKPPRNKEEICVILEDDLTVSPYFYRYLKLVHQKYRHRPGVAGFALQGSSVRHTDGRCCLNVPLENMVYLHPTHGTWGYSPTNDKWSQFIDWYQNNLKNNITAPLPKNNVNSLWYKALARKGRADTMWAHIYVYYTDTHNEWTLYPNFPGHRGLAFHWQESGLHYSRKNTRKPVEEADNLLQEWTFKLTALPDDPIHVEDLEKNEPVNYTIRNQLQDPKFENTIDLDYSLGTPLIKYMEQAVLKDPDNFKGFATTFSFPYGYFIDSINGVAGNWDVDKTYWRVSNENGPLTVGVSSYIPKAGDKILFDFIVGDGDCAKPEAN